MLTRTGAVVHVQIWEPLRARIAGFAAAYSLCLAATAQAPQAREFVEAPLVDVLIDLLSHLGEFERTHSNTLPSGASEALKCVNLWDVTFLRGYGRPKEGFFHKTAVKVIALGHEIDFHLSDTEQGLRSMTELAFNHLQRQIETDAEIRGKWYEAWSERETACERLGSAHLLWHGIYAFKVNAAGQQTDLVYNEPARSAFAAGAHGIVLTEWKVLRAGDDPETVFARARVQAERYEIGALGGVELRRCRYLVLVSQRQVTDLPKWQVEGIEYRGINISVSPRTPSAHAASIAATTKP